VRTPRSFSYSQSIAREPSARGASIWAEGFRSGSIRADSCRPWLRTTNFIPILGGRDGPCTELKKSLGNSARRSTFCRRRQKRLEQRMLRMSP